MTSSSDTDVSHLTAEQQESLQTYISITDQETSQALPLLERSQWNVQVSLAASELLQLVCRPVNLIDFHPRLQ